MMELPKLVSFVMLWANLAGGSSSPPIDHNTNDDGACVLDIAKINYEHVIHVDPTLSSNDTTCQLDLDPIHCPNLNSALRLQWDKSTAYVLAATSAGITHYLEKDAHSTWFEETSDIAFFANSTDDTAYVLCLENAGLAFWNVERIIFQSIKLSHCGVRRWSTTKDFGDDSFFKFTVGLYFYNCTHITMCRVAVQDSNSVGVAMFDTDGKVNVYHSNFTNNTALTNTSTAVGGGGFIVEFSYCVPSDSVTCNTSNHQTTHNANASYTFSHSNFSNNIANYLQAKRILPFNKTHEGIGQGGGLALYFKSNAADNVIHIINCVFRNNSAVWGGGVYISFQDSSIGNKVILENVFFYENNCFNFPDYGNAGGGIRILSVLHHQYDDINQASSNEANSVKIITGYFQYNRALYGGALSYGPTHQKTPIEYTTQLEIADSVFLENYGSIGAAIHVELLPLISEGYVSPVNIHDTTIQYNSIDYMPPLASEYDLGLGVVYTFLVPINFSSIIKFEENYGTALAVLSTYVDFCDTNASFVGNVGDEGGGISFLGNSYSVVNDNTLMHFDSNFARIGGAIYNYIITQGVLKSSFACFIRYNNPFIGKKDWKATFVFDNNTSTELGSSSIFSTSVYPCGLNYIREGTPLPKMLLFCVNPHWKFVNSNCTSEIHTQGDQYNFQNDTTLSTFPGQGLPLPITVLDDLGHNISNSTGYMSTISNPYNQSVARVDPRYTLTSGNFLVITGKENSTVSLKLQSSGSRPHFLQIAVHLQMCPPGFHFDSPQQGRGFHSGSAADLGRCKCRYAFSYRGMLNCSMQTLEAQIPFNYWIGLDPTGELPRELVMSPLPYLYSEQHFKHVYNLALPKSYDELDDRICGGKNRTGPICGKCKENYSVSVNSYDYSCTRCDDETNFVKNIFLLLLFAYIPYIILLGVVVFFNLKLASSATTGFILFAHMTSIDVFNINESSRVVFNTLKLHKSYLFVYGIFNFNSFASVMSPFCIGKNFTTLDVLCLEYTLAGLPLVIILVICTLLRLKEYRCVCCRRRQQTSIQDVPTSRPLFRWKQRNKKRKTSQKPILHALVSFILLSYTKISLVSMKILATQLFFDKDGNSLDEARIALAGHMAFNTREYFFPYGFLAMFVMVFVLISPLFLLGLPQLIDRILDSEKLSCLRRLWPAITIHTILDAFQGFYKPNRRFFAGVYFVFRLCILFTYVSVRDYLSQYIIQQSLVTLMIVLLSIFKPYKREVFNIVDTLIFMIMAILNSISTYAYAASSNVGGEENTRISFGIYFTEYCLIWLPLIYMLSYMLYKSSIRIGFHQYLKKKLERYHSGRHLPLLLNDTSELDQSLEGGESTEDYLDSLSDASLFKRAEDENKYKSLGGKRGPTTSLVSVLADISGGNEEGSLEANINTGSSGIGTSSD